MAQIGSALPWGGRGRRFKSGHSDQLFCKQCKTVSDLPETVFLLADRSLNFIKPTANILAILRRYNILIENKPLS